MHKCLHNKRKDFCYDCVLEINAYQGKAIEQLHKRLNYTWKRVDDTIRKIMMDAETKYPLAATQILASYPIKDENNFDEYTSVVKEATNSLKEFRKQFHHAKIRYYDSSFIIYNDL